MSLTVYINSGARKGSKIYLKPIPEEVVSQYLLEDEDVSFEYMLPLDLLNMGYQTVTLNLHEVSYDPIEVQRMANQEVRFAWKSNKPPSKIDLFFRNYCGIADLSIKIKGYNLEDVIVNFESIDILASKLSAERITAMLDFLSENDAHDITALARITKRLSTNRSDIESISSLLDKISNNLLMLRTFIPGVLNKPIVKILPTKKIVNFTPNSFINYDSISWLSNNLEEISECGSQDNFDIKIDKKHYKIKNILIQELLEDTDIYENQVIHGFVNVLIGKVIFIINEYNKRNINHSKNSNINGYFSLYSKIQNFQSSINKNLLEKLNYYLRELLRIRSILKSNLKVSRIITTQPVITLKVKNNISYQTIFRKMIELKKLGNPDWTLYDELNSIRDIPKLFEYYTFCLTKRIIENTIKSSFFSKNGFLFSERENENSISFFYNNFYIDIFYEPKIWGDKDTLGVLPNLINSEAWEINNSRINPRKNKFKGEKSRHRSPDIVVRLDLNGNEKFIILDAKYTNDFLAWETYLPDLVMKYIHGIHSKSGNNTTLALMVLSPSEQSTTRHYLDYDFTIHGSKPVYPSLLNARLNLDSRKHLQGDFSGDIDQIFKTVFSPFIS